MEYRPLGRTGVRVSQLCLGTMMFGGRTDRAESLRLYELAVAITPNHPEARTGLIRAQNLEAVLRLVDSGEQFEEDLELDAAEVSFQQAVDLDPNWAPALEGLERVRATRTKIQFDSRMSEGLEALAVGDYLSARAAFRMAQQLIPGSPEPRDGLMQVDQGLRLNRITALEADGAAQVAAEQWETAAETYEAVLEIDEKADDKMIANVVFGGRLRGRPGVHVPSDRLQLATPTPDDFLALDAFVDAGVDMVAISFVRSAAVGLRDRTRIYRSSMISSGLRPSFSCLPT